jgi:holo-[acyl-carrier protein] synthase
MIVGIGIDIEEVTRVEDVLDRWGERFTRRFFAENEIRYCAGKAKPAQHFAARFAAKEAFSKALGTGWSGNFRWTDIEVVNDEAGKPGIRLHNRLGESAGNVRHHLSLSHTNSYVTAMVVIERLEQ